MTVENNILVCVEDNDIENGTVVIPECVTEIGYKAFIYCKYLKTIKIPENVTKIGDEAFRNCSALEIITISKNVREIGEYAFEYCYSLKKIRIPENVISIEAGLFKGCSSLKTIKIPENVTNIEDRVFYRCGLQSKKGNYKVFNKGLQCLDMQYNPYEWNEIDGDIIMCEHGLHYVTNMFDIFSYHAGNLEEDIEIWEVEPGNIIVDNDEDSTKATNKIKPIRKLSRIEIINILNNK